MNYSFLLEVLEEIWEQEAGEYCPSKNRELVLDVSNPLVETLCQKLSVTPELLYLFYIKPYLGMPNMDEEALQAITELQSRWSAKENSGFVGRFFGEQQLVFKVERADSLKEFQDFNWLIAQVMDLNLRGLALPPDRIYGKFLYFQPYKQCLFCGRVDKDTRGKTFTEKDKFCHAIDCESKGPNPEDHPDCCYGKWKAKKKVFKTWLKRAERRGASVDEIREKFKGFCLERLSDIRVRISRAIRNKRSYEHFKTSPELSLEHPASTAS